MLGLTVLIFPIVIIAVGVLIYIEKKLAVKENFACGLVPILVVAVIGAGLTAVCYHTVNGYSTKTLTETMKNGNEAQVTVKYDRDGRVLCHTYIVIKNQKGEILERIGTYYDVEEGEENPYKNLIDKFGISGNSTDEEQLNGKYVVLDDHSFLSPSAPLIIMIIIEMPFLIIYLHSRKLLKTRRRYEEERRFKIEQI